MQPSKKTVLLEKQIARLRALELSNAAIARQIKEPVWRINYIIRRLQAQSRVSRRQFNHQPKYRWDTIDRMICELRGMNLSNDQICGSLKLSKHQFTRRVSHLIRLGKLERRAFGLRAKLACKNVSFWRDPNDPLFGQFVGWIRSGESRTKIGKRLGRSGTRVTQIVCLMKTRYGAGLFSTSSV